MSRVTVSEGYRSNLGRNLRTPQTTWSNLDLSVTLEQECAEPGQRSNSKELSSVCSRENGQ